jgi:hypothetical protein
MTVKAHFDGTVIIPDEPLNLAPNQAVIVQIEPVDGSSDMTKEPALTWLAENAAEGLTQPQDLADQHDHYLYGLPLKDARR